MEQIGNQLVTTFEVERKFKDGDVVIAKTGNICIFKQYTGIAEFESYLSNSGLSDFGWVDVCFRLATPEEAQQLWDALAKEGKRWNPETKQVEPLRWRGEMGEKYYSLYWDNIVTATEDGRHLDNIRYNSGNYFRTKEQAEMAKLYIQRALDEFWKEELK